METNKLAQDLLETLSWREKTLAPDLAEIAQTGFIADDGCYFLAWGDWIGNKRRYLDSQRRTPERHSHLVSNETWLECWMNSFAIHTPGRTDVFAQGMLFAQRIATDWAQQYPDKALSVIVGFQWPNAVAPYGQANVKFHLTRADQSYLGPDLEKIIQPVIRLNSMMDVV